jgi:hypothetical protein
MPPDMLCNLSSTTLVQPFLPSLRLKGHLKLNFVSGSRIISRSHSPHVYWTRGKAQNGGNATQPDIVITLSTMSQEYNSITYWYLPLVNSENDEELVVNYPRPSRPVPGTEMKAAHNAPAARLTCTICDVAKQWAEANLFFSLHPFVP